MIMFLTYFLECSHTYRDIIYKGNVKFTKPLQANWKEYNTIHSKT